MNTILLVEDFDYTYKGRPFKGSSIIAKSEYIPGNVSSIKISIYNLVTDSITVGLKIGQKNPLSKHSKLILLRPDDSVINILDSSNYETVNDIIKEMCTL